MAAQTEARGSTNGATPSPSPRVSFSELAREHHRWAQQFDHDGEAADRARERYRSALAAFEQDAGRVLDAYWCSTDASAVALTRRDRRWGRHDYRLHRVSDWVTAGMEDVAALLHECDILAIKATETPDRLSKGVMMQSLLSVEAHVLGFIERTRGMRPTPEERAAFVREERRRLRAIEDYYQETGERRGRWSYVLGMLVFGGVLLVAAGVLLAVGLWLFDAFDRTSAEIRLLYACAAAGGLGAFVSVLLRMAGRGGGFNIDHELGHWRVWLLGSYRPLIGAISGVALYFLVKTSLVAAQSADPAGSSFDFAVIVAFLAGFSERWTKVVLGGAMRTIGGDPETEAERRREPAPEEPRPVDA